VRQPKLSDKELIALSLTAEYLCIDSEYQLFRMLPFSLKSRIERSVYNRRRKGLFSKTPDGTYSTTIIKESYQTITNPIMVSPSNAGYLGHTTSGNSVVFQTLLAQALAKRCL
jgi:hypothetical protein